MFSGEEGWRCSSNKGITKMIFLETSPVFLLLSKSLLAYSSATGGIRHSLNRFSGVVKFSLWATPSSENVSELFFMRSLRLIVEFQ